MLSIKIEIGWDRAHCEKKKAPDIKKAVWLAALLDSVVWLADTVLWLNIFYAMPLFPFGILLIFGVLLSYLIYFRVKTKFLTKKYGKEIYRAEFGQNGLLLAAASAALLFVLIIIFYV